ncbi:MAG TPA: alpha/beta hydrolase-fold protein [Actinomycetota bacterium]|nr:alpha/beta hydrolase-fold protein [Actinomycetota bacterium]
MGAAAVMVIEHGPLVLDDVIVFSLPDPDKALTSVRLLQEIRRPRNGPEFLRGASEDVWRAAFLRPKADRMEYLLELHHQDGGHEVIPDPANPLRAPGPFGDKSVLELPGYEQPAWAGVEAPAGEETPTLISSRILHDRMPAIVWAPPDTDPDEPLPLLVAHDGPEYARYSGLTHYLSVMVSTGRLPRMRAGLVGPVDRDNTYSASAAYSRAFAHEILPALDRLAPTPHGRAARVGMGASLGGLAMLVMHRRAPATFGGLFLQSGSFFRQRFDAHESGFPRFRRISRFVGGVLTADDWAHPVPVTMTCGTVEENLANNRAVRDALAAQGYDVYLHENRDAHNWIGWRDTFDPHLTNLLTKVWT